MTQEIQIRIKQIKNSQIPEGYKKTSLGIIPNDWEIVSLSEVCSVSSGNTPQRKSSENFAGDITWITSGELKKKKIYDSIEKITRDAVKKGNLKIYDEGTVIVAIYGLEADGVRGTASIAGTKCTISQACMAFSDFKKISNEYFYYWYMHNGEIIGHRYAQGTKQQNLNFDIVEKIQISFPTLPEQNKIAEILSTQDKLIEQKEKLLAEKQKQKKYLMQQLLSGKLRIVGNKCHTDLFAPARNFVANNGTHDNGEWKVVKLGEIGNFYNGLTGKTKDDFGQGNASYITFLNVLSNTYIDINRLEKVNIKPNEIQNMVKYGDLFFNTSSEIPEEVGMCSVLLDKLNDTYLNSFCFGFRLHTNDNPLYLSYYFNSSIGRDIMKTLAQGATRYNLSKNGFSKTLITLPPLPEQNVIAEILSTADKEIELLQKNIEQEKLKKKSLMQLLLTGIVRVKI